MMSMVMRFPFPFHIQMECVCLFCDSHRFQNNFFLRWHQSTSAAHLDDIFIFTACFSIVDFPGLEKKKKLEKSLRRDFFSCSNKNKTAMMTATSRLTQHTTHTRRQRSRIPWKSCWLQYNNHNNKNQTLALGTQRPQNVRKLVEIILAVAHISSRPLARPQKNKNKWEKTPEKFA